MLLREPFVTILATLCNPLPEGFSDTSVDDVTDVSARHLANLAQDRQRIDDLRVAQPEVQDVVHLEVFILG